MIERLRLPMAAVPALPGRPESMRFPTKLFGKEDGRVTVGEDDTWFYDVLPMGFNVRLVMTPKDNLDVYEWAWCYRAFRPALASFLVWEQDVQDEPVGWHKRPTYESVRRAPRREERLAENRARCIHGAVIEERSCESVMCPAWSGQRNPQLVTVQKEV